MRHPSENDERLLMRSSVLEHGWPREKLSRRRNSRRAACFASIWLLVFVTAWSALFLRGEGRWNAIRWKNIASLNLAVSLQNRTNPFFRPNPPVLNEFSSCSVDCPWVTSSYDYPNTVEVTLETFEGYGRTGNYVISLRQAVDLALGCRKTIRLPHEDNRGHAFKVNETFSVMDFTNVPGSPHALCENVRFPLSGDARFFWFLNDTMTAIVRDERQSGILANLKGGSSPASVRLESCVRKYLGICDEGYCSFPQTTGHFDPTASDSLVIHLREGDIYREKLFDPALPPRAVRMHGQPPLSFYLQALRFIPWRNAAVVTHGEQGPIRQALLLLNGTLSSKLHFQMTNWFDDLRTCLCAANLVVSRSTLEAVYPLGFARKVFSLSCMGNAIGDKEIYRISIDSKDYEWFWGHDNSAREWVQMLLHRAPEPILCAKVYDNRVQRIVGGLPVHEY